MRDQAEQLRAKLKMQHGIPAKTLAVASGKGGVGKSNISVNLAMALAERGKKSFYLTWMSAWAISTSFSGLTHHTRSRTLSTGISHLPK